MTKIGEMADEAKKVAELAQKMMVQALPIIDNVVSIVDRIRLELEEDQLQVRLDICGIKDVLVLHFDMTDVAGNLKDIKCSTTDPENLDRISELLEKFSELLERFGNRQKN